jgi:hypothetical protein
MVTDRVKSQREYFFEPMMEKAEMNVIESKKRKQGVNIFNLDFQFCFNRPTGR